VIKKEITESEALEYAIKITETGSECYIAAIPRPADTVLSERKRTDERRLRFRREASKARSNFPDRRHKIRRLDDAESFEELHIHHRKIPVGFLSYGREK
jgi:hypothetical protein